MIKVYLGPQLEHHHTHPYINRDVLRFYLAIGLNSNENELAFCLCGQAKYGKPMKSVRCLGK